jgi:hypothetical protein
LDACTELGVMYEKGRGVAKDEARAAALYKQACDGGYAGGCVDLGAAYASGRGVAKDELRAVALYKQVCDTGPCSGPFQSPCVRGFCLPNM